MGSKVASGMCLGTALFDGKNARPVCGNQNKSVLHSLKNILHSPSYFITLKLEQMCFKMTMNWWCQLRHPFLHTANNMYTYVHTWNSQCFNCREIQEKSWSMSSCVCPTGKKPNFTYKSPYCCKCTPIQSVLPFWRSLTVPIGLQSICFCCLCMCCPFECIKLVEGCPGRNKCIWGVKSSNINSYVVKWSINLRSAC